MNEAITNSSGNVFLDLGFPPGEATVLQMRAQLMVDIKKFIRERKLNRTAAAKILGISSTRVAELLEGKWENFSLEMLINLATKAGLNISLRRAA